MKKKQIRTVVNQEKVAEHLKLHLGKVRNACKTALVSKTQFYHWFKQDEDFRELIIQIYRDLKLYILAEKLTRVVNASDKDLTKIFNTVNTRVIVHKKL